MKYSLFILAIFGFILYYRLSPLEPYEFKGVAMTVPYRILVGHHLDSSEIFAIRDKIDAIFERTNRVYNKWNPESEISLFNRMQKGESLQISDRLTRLMDKTDEMWQLTGGLFDPTIEGKSIGWDLVGRYGCRLTKRGDVLVDLGGIAKGQTIDELAEELGYENVLVEWGGDFRAKGEHPDGRPWLVAIKNPFGGEVATVELRNEALATSGDYEQFDIVEGKHLCHIIDPRTGEKLERREGSVVSCSVVGKTCVEADAVATASMLFQRGQILNQWTKELQDFSFYFVFCDTP